MNHEFDRNNLWPNSWLIPGNSCLKDNTNVHEWNTNLTEIYDSIHG